MNKFRLFISSALVWTAGRIAPKPFSQVFGTYTGFLTGWHEQLELGRTYGVVTIAWSSDPEMNARAWEMEDAAMRVLQEMRAKNEAVDGCLAGLDAIEKESANG